MLLFELRKHQRLAAKRHPMFEKNRFGKFLMYFMVIFWAGYLIMFGTLFPSLFREMFPYTEPYYIMSKGIPVLLLIDFALRFIFQKPPTQEIKPYLLLPVKKSKLLNFLLLKSATANFNFIWLFMLVPFAFLTIFRFYGVSGVFLYCFGFWLLAVLNNYWYLLCITLINEKTIYLLLPVLYYTGVGAIEFTSGFPISNFCMNLGEAFITGNPLSFAGIIAAITILWLLNRYIMAKNLYAELAKNNDNKMKHVSDYRFLERYGEVGEYFRLELKLLFRNKRPKHMLRMGCFFIILLTFMLFTPSYEGPIGKSFVCIYNFAVLSILMLTQLMSFEGNYLDGLMSRKESIYTLLKAKYYFYSIVMIIPFILMIPAIVMGKITWLMAVSYGFFTTGFIYFLLFQLAVYNCKTTPLNENVIGRQSAGTGFQNLISLCAFGLPLLLSSLLRTLFGETASLWVLLVIGVMLTFTSGFWLKNVYKRFMMRRYKNMEGFRDTK